MLPDIAIMVATIGALQVASILLRKNPEEHDVTKSLSIIALLVLGYMVWDVVAIGERIGKATSDIQRTLSQP